MSEQRVKGVSNLPARVAKKKVQQSPVQHASAKQQRLGQSSLTALSCNLEKLNTAIQTDKMLQDVISSDPQLAELLKPDNLHLVTQALLDGDFQGSGELLSTYSYTKHRKTLMHLQNYLSQLRLRQSGVGNGSSGQQGGGRQVMYDKWQQLQARLNHLQERRSMIQPTGSLAAQGTFQQPQGHAEWLSTASRAAPLELSCPQDGLGGAAGVLAPTLAGQDHGPPIGTDGTLFWPPPGHMVEPCAVNDRDTTIGQSAGDSGHLPGGNDSWQGSWSGVNLVDAGLLSGVPMPEDSKHLAGLDPKTYYEEVAPSPWRPGEEDSCCSMYRRAYCQGADALFPVMWVTLMTLLLHYTRLSLGTTLLVMALTFLFGIYGASILAGVPTSKLMLSKAVLSFVAVGEVSCLVLFIVFMREAWLARGLEALVLSVGLVTLPCLHHTLATGNPGFVPHRAVDDEETAGDQSLGHDHKDDFKKSHLATLDVDRSKSDHYQSDQVTVEDESPILGTSVRDEVAPGKLVNAKAQPESHPGLHLCWTCGVDRPLRAKHCPLCGRCVLRFDHHCPAIGNCVGSGNQRLFLTYMSIMVVSQVLFLRLSWWLVLSWVPAGGASGLAVISTINQEYKLQEASRRATVVMMIAQVPLLVAASYLLIRGVLLMMANLTTSEWINRNRYLYLNQEVVGFCNRFDRGVLHNVWQFWCEPKVDWWKEFEEGDEEMRRMNETFLSTWCLSRWIRWWDVRWQLYEKKLRENRKMREELRLRRRLEALGLS